MRGVWIIVAALVCGAGGLGQAISPAPLVLSCSSAQDVPQAQVRVACDVLAEVLTTTLPGRRVQRGGPGPEDALSLLLRITQVLPRRISATLAWKEGAHSGSSPEISVRVVDTDLDDATYRLLSQQLIQSAGLPFLSET